MMSPRAHRALRKIQDLLRSGRCRGTDAVDQSGATVDPTSPHAVRWCVAGAVDRVTANTTLQVRDDVVEALYARLAPHACAFSTGAKLEAIAWATDDMETDVLIQKMEGAIPEK